MLMKGDEYFDVAALLESVGGPFEEGRLRSAVSRLYYSAFLQARDALIANCGFRFSNRDSHKEVGRAFEWSDDKASRAIGKSLAELKKLRENADYETAPSRDPAAVKEAKQLYASIVAKFASIDYSLCRNPSDDRGGR